ncbi:hypothetical protein SESBI_34619 [Sesbania bispinosa]|nr:hypothetical protein SESBI_34619 [Sesbania bispinosa]
MPEQEVPVINLSDEGSPVLNNAGDLDNEDPSLSQDLEANPIVPKIYICFLGDVADRSYSPVLKMKGFVTPIWLATLFLFTPTYVSSNLLFNSDGTSHFPLFWSLEPHKVPQTPLSVLFEGDRAAVEWLREQKNVDCCALLKNEDNPVELQTLLGSMPPKSQTTKTMDEVTMLKALRAKEKKAKATEKNTASSVECLGTGPVQGDGGNPSAIQNTTGNPLPNPTSGSSEKWWALFNDFEGGTSDVGSIFDRRFPIDQIIEKHLNQKEDRTRVQKVGMRNIGKKLQSSGAQMAFFDLYVDQYVGSAEKELKNLILKNKELTEKIKNVEGDMKTVERLKTDLKAIETKNTELLAEKNTWDEKFADLGKKIGYLQKNNDDLVAENKNLGSKHTAGFDKAVTQLQFLYPDLKVDEVGAFIMWLMAS